MQQTTYTSRNANKRYLQLPTPFTVNGRLVRSYYQDFPFVLLVSSAFFQLQCTFELLGRAGYMTPYVPYFRSNADYSRKIEAVQGPRADFI